MENQPFAQAILDLIFPSACLGCGSWLEHGSVYCEPCYERLPRFNTLFCGKCRNRLPQGKKLCHRDFPYLLGAATDYRDPGVSALVASLKFKSNQKAAEPLGILLATYASELPLPSRIIVIPIPLSTHRMRERGFNQAELLARPLAHALQLELRIDVLRRIKNTTPQSDILHAEERALNVHGCFEASLAAPIIDRDIILIDDVITSGSTLLEAARTLKHAGAKSIMALAAAKA